MFRHQHRNHLLVPVYHRGQLTYTYTFHPLAALCLGCVCISYLCEKEILWRGVRNLLGKLSPFLLEVTADKRSSVYQLFVRSALKRKNERVALTRCLRRNPVGFWKVLESVCGLLRLLRRRLIFSNSPSKLWSCIHPSPLDFNILWDYDKLPNLCGQIYCFKYDVIEK